MLGMIDKAVRYLGNLKAKKKLLAIYLLTGILPVLCLGGFLISNTGNLVMQQHRSQTEAENKRVKIVLFDVTYLASNVSQILFFDRQLKEIIAKPYKNQSEVYEAYRSYTAMDTYMSNYTEISGITVYVDNPTMIPYGHYQIATEDIKKTEWYQKAANSTGGIYWAADSSLSKDGYLFLVRKIPVDYSGSFAVLTIRISNNFLSLMMSDSNLHSIAALGYGPVFYSDNAAEVCRPLGLNVKRENPQILQTGEFEYNGRKSLVSNSVLNPINTSDEIQIITIDQRAEGNMDGVVLSISMIVAISLIVPVIIILFFTSSFSRRIDTLRGEMHKVAAGDFNIIGTFTGRDELSDVYADMKTMIGCIQNLYKEIYNEKLTKERLAARQQRIEFEMLSSQINPHFLFNTLETIRMKAHINGDAEVSHITKLLGQSIRHLLEAGNEPVSLASELLYIKIYIDIQIFRFRGKIGYSVAIADDVDASGYHILPLLIQPIVENSIVHGLERKKSGGWVRIEIRHMENRLAITVSDNGIGMRAGQYEALANKLSGLEGTQTRGSIGLINVHQRIKLFYGPAYGLKIASKQGEGTVVSLLLPSGEKGASNESSDHR